MSIATNPGSLGSASGSAELIDSRYPWVDLLRGVAVLLVVLHHIHLRFVLSDIPVATLFPTPFSRVVFWSGYYAVVMFFVISGFLITHHSLRRWRTLPRVDVGAFYWMRFTRIYPTLLLLLSVLACLHLAGARGYVIDPERASLGRAVVSALTFHFNWLEGTRGYLPGAWDVLWSLSVEEAFYLGFPVACLVLRRDALLGVVALVLIVVGPANRVHTAGQEPWEEYAYLSCMDGIAFGCVAAWLHRRVRFGARTKRLALVIGVTLTLLVIAARQTTSALGLPGVGLNVSVLEVGTAMVLLGAVGAAADGRVLRASAWLRATGRRSYEIYLSHMFVVLALPGLFRASAADLRWVALWYVAGLSLSVALGTAVSRWYSEALLHVLRRFTPQVRTTAVLPSTDEL